MSANNSLRMEVMTEDPPIQGQKWCCLSMVSPESRQKAKVHALKIRYVSDSPEEAEYMARKLRDRDPDFDVYVGPIGKWIPWIWSADEVPTKEYQNSALTELIRAHKEEVETATDMFEERRQKERERHQKRLKGGDSDSEPKESTRSLFYKMLQLRKVIEDRQRQLADIESLFNSDVYTDEERAEAERHTYPTIQVAEPSYQVTL